MELVCVKCTVCHCSVTGALAGAGVYQEYYKSFHVFDLNCNGTEDQIFNCSHNSIQHCQYNKDANVQCPSKLYSCCNISNYVIVPDTTDNCTYGEIRLINGQSQYEGLVEICNNGHWEYICPRYWGNNDAKVACRQLGYTDIGKLKILIIINYISFRCYCCEFIW